jgi:hypothetical protein
MDLIADLMWIAGTALSLGFMAYGAYLVLVAPHLPIEVRPRLRFAS